jgi:tripartite-type tricarboxylate transporter receptor subunit TctC
MRPIAWRARRTRRIVVAAIACLSLSFDDASAQSYPVRPIRMLFGAGAGGAGDISARMVAQKLGEALGQNVIVDVRPGAGSAIATEAVAKAPPDGYMLLYATGAFATLPVLRAKLPYDVEKDFAPVSLVVTNAFLLAVHPSVPVRDVRGLIALARARPASLTFSSPGVGTSAHFVGELFSMMSGVRLLHVPYKGAPEAATAVAAGEIDIAFPAIASALPLIGTAKLRPIAVSSMKRASLMSSIPTLNESGLPGYDRAGWNGVVAQGGVSKDIIARLSAIIVKAVSAPEMNDALIKLGFEPQGGTPEQFVAFIRSELAQNAKLVKFAGIRNE